MVMWKQGSDPRDPNEEVIQEQLQASAHYEIAARGVEVAGNSSCIMRVLIVLRMSPSLHPICVSTGCGNPTISAALKLSLVSFCHDNCVMWI